MKNDQRLFLLGIQESSFWDTLVVFLSLSVSPGARKRRGQFLQIEALLRKALSDSDSLYEVEIRAPRFVKGNALFHGAVFLGLMVIAAYEWTAFSGPVLTEWLSAIMHRCGVK